MTRVRIVPARLAAAMPLAAILFASACATAKPAPRVDLEPARKAVGEARAAGGPQDAKDALARAESHLREAEALAGQTIAVLVPGAQHAADLAVADAQCALAAAHLSTLHEAAAASHKIVAPSDAERAAATRLRRAEEEQHRLEDKLTLLQRELDLTETELIRSKARVKGNETKAEASAAIAEARILARRLSQDRSRASSFARAQASLERAEEQLAEGNFGAAIFFALKAQDTATKAPDAPGESAADKAPAKKTYIAKSAINLRKGPATTEAIVAKIAAGTKLLATAVRGDWVKVTFEGNSGWAYRSLLE